MKDSKISFGDDDMDDLLRQASLVARIKGADYAEKTDGLANFKKAAEAAGITPRQAWFVFFHKHLCAIEKFIRNGRVESESIDGRIIDAIVYLLLLHKMIQEEV